MTGSRCWLLWAGILIAAIAVVLWCFVPKIAALASDASRSAAVQQLQSRSTQMDEPMRSAACSSWPHSSGVATSRDSGAGYTTASSSQRFDDLAIAVGGLAKLAARFVDHAEPIVAIVHFGIADQQVPGGAFGLIEAAGVDEVDDGIGRRVQRLGFQPRGQLGSLVDGLRLELCFYCAYSVLVNNLSELSSAMVATFPDVLEAAREPGTSRFSASGIANLLGIQQQDLAELAGVHRNTLRTHPESPRLQSTLRDLMRVLSAATAVQPDPQRAIFLIKNEPIPAFRHKTLLQLVQEGRTDDAIGYLESISAGFVG